MYILRGLSLQLFGHFREKITIIFSNEQLLTDSQCNG